MPEQARILWAPKVRRDLIRRLYETEARGICDEELIDEVGFALWARCNSILEVTEASRGRPKCHGCGASMRREGHSDCDLTCAACGWSTTWGTYHRSFRGKQLFGGAALPLFASYVERFLKVDTPRDKILMIDRLITEFHWNLIRGGTEPTRGRPTAANLIEGSTLREVMEFLDGLSGRA